MPDPVRHARLIAEGRCVDCAQPRGDSPVATRCAVCAAKHRAAQIALRRKKRLEKPWSDLTDGDPLPVGASPVHAVAHLRIPLTAAALQGLNLLKKRERDRCRVAGERYIGFHLSRLIREHIQTFTIKDFPAPPRAFNTELTVTFHCDAETLAIIDYYARRFDGNRAATVRAMLAAIVAPPTIRDHDEDDFQSPFDDPRFYEKKRQQVHRENVQAEAIQRDAAINHNQPRKNFWEYSPAYQDNVARGKQKRDDEG